MQLYLGSARKQHRSTLKGSKQKHEVLRFSSRRETPSSHVLNFRATSGGRTQFQRALLLMQFSTCTRISKNKHAVNRAIILFTQNPTICVIFLYNCMQCIDGFSILYQRYFIKGNDAKNPAIFSFCYRKNPVKCTHAQLLEKLRSIA